MYHKDRHTAGQPVDSVYQLLRREKSAYSNADYAVHPQCFLKRTCAFQNILFSAT